MAMRSQVYEWTNLAPTTNGSNIRQSSNPTQVEIAADKSLDIFIGGKGTNITQPASTTATQFVVIEDIAASPQAGGHSASGSSRPCIPLPKRNFI